MPVILFFIAVWYLSLFSQSFFHHRYASHRAFTMSKGWERFFFVVTFITQGAHYLSPKAYAMMHRMHHAYADTEKDPHSPNFSKTLVGMMLRTHKIYSGILRGKIKVDNKFTKNLPVWEKFDMMASSNLARLLWIAGYVAFFAAFATAAWQWVFLPVIIVMSAFHGAIINWFAHKYGYRNFWLRNTSLNLFFVDLIMWGEAYHNNHHKHPSSANFGVRWHEIDPMYPVILLFNKVGIIKLNKIASSPAIEEQHSTQPLHPKEEILYEEVV